MSRGERAATAGEWARFDLPLEVQKKLFALAALIAAPLVVGARNGSRLMWASALALMIVAASIGLLIPRGFTLMGGERFGFELYPQWAVLAVGGVALFLHGARVVRLRMVYQLFASVLIAASMLRLGLGEWIV